MTAKLPPALAGAPELFDRIFSAPTSGYIALRAAMRAPGGKT